MSVASPPQRLLKSTLHAAPLEQAIGVLKSRALMPASAPRPGPCRRDFTDDAARPSTYPPQPGPREA
jgi:hypothetical protein